MREIKAEKMKQGDILALPMNRTATILYPPHVGTRYVNFETEHGKSRVEIGHPMLLLIEETP